MSNAMTTINANRLAKLLALAGSNHDGEATTALRKVNEMLKAAGMSFTDVAEKLRAPTALAVHTGHQQHAPAGADIFTGFDDWMDAKEPGWKAKQAAQRAERDRRQAEERTAVIAKYGSEEAATAPCERERTLNAATAHLARKFKKTYANGTFTVDGLDGWNGGIGDAPASVIEVVSNALPMPTTIREAKEEHEYWEARDREIDAVYGFTGNRQVGLAAEARWDMVRKLYERDMPILTVDDMHARLQFVAASDWREDACDAAPSLLEAFERLVVNAGPLADGTATAVQNEQPARASDRRARVLAMLSNPDTAGWSDRAIAKAAGVSPTTVGTLRKSSATSDPVGGLGKAKLVMLKDERAAEGLPGWTLFLAERSERPVGGGEAR